MGFHWDSPKGGARPALSPSLKEEATHALRRLNSIQRRRSSASALTRDESSGCGVDSPALLLLGGGGALSIRRNLMGGKLGCGGVGHGGAAGTPPPVCRPSPHPPRGLQAPRL